MKKSKIRSISCILLSALMFLMVAGCGSTSKAPASSDKPAQGSQKRIELRMATASPGGTRYPIGAGIAEIIMREVPGVNVSVESGGSQANIKALESGAAELAMLYSADMLLAQNGQEPFKDKITKMRDLCMLFDSPYQLTVRGDAGITSLKGLVGKKLGTVQFGTGGEFMNRVILEASGVTYKDLQVQYSTNTDLVDLMKDKHLDAVANIGGVPYPLVIEVGSSQKVKLLSIPDDVQKKVMEVNPGYTPYTIPAGTYAAQGCPEEIKTMSMTTRLACSSELPEDLVKKIMEAIAKNQDQLGSIVASMKGKKPADLYQDIKVPYHPGAAAFYKSIGAIK